MIDKVEEVIPDLVLTDLHMPGMDGMEALAHIRSNINTKVAAVPIAALTGDVKPGEKERCLALGMMGFLVKPFVEAQLVELVDSVFKKSS
jgi:CheY-like chemotaxis protein